ncbi:MAG: hypothetical protein ACFCGT_15590 [Sandaracinaceae bacterium]
MATNDDELEEVCDDCGGAIADESTAFGLPDEGWLCAACAIARGGQLDAGDGTWRVAPRIDDLMRPD